MRGPGAKVPHQPSPLLIWSHRAWPGRGLSVCLLRLRRDEWVGWGSGVPQASRRGQVRQEREGAESGGERAGGRLMAVVCTPWVPFNSVNVPGWRHEGSSIIKRTDTRGWARNLKAIYRVKGLNFGEGGQELEPQAGVDEGGGPPGELLCQVSISKSTIAVPARLLLPRRPLRGLLGTSPKAVMTALLPPRGGFPMHGSKRSSGFGGTRGGFLPRGS